MAKQPLELLCWGTPVLLTEGDRATPTTVVSDAKQRLALLQKGEVIARAEIERAERGPLVGRQAKRDLIELLYLLSLAQGVGLDGFLGVEQSDPDGERVGARIRGTAGRHEQARQGTEQQAREQEGVVFHSGTHFLPSQVPARGKG